MHKRHVVTDLFSELVVWRLREFDLRELHFGGVVDDRLGRETVRAWVLDEGLYGIQSSLGLGPKRFPVPVLLILNFRESTAWRRGGQGKKEVRGRVGWREAGKGVASFPGLREG